MTPTRPFGPVDLLGALAHWPPTSFVVASAIAVALAVVTTSTARCAGSHSSAVVSGVSVRYSSERRAFGIVAMATAVTWLGDFILRGYVLGGASPWTRFTVPLACAIVGLGLVLSLIVTRGSAGSPVAGSFTARRTWIGFTSPGLLITSAGAVAMLVLTTVAAGILSTPNGEGEYVWLTVPIPNEPGIDALRLPFYGWTYGVPVLIGLGALLPVVWATLDRNAARPFLSAELAPQERLARRRTARYALSISTAATLLTLAGTWRLIAAGGTSQYLIVTGQNEDAPYDAAWRYGELALAAGWTAPVLEVIALTILFVVTARTLLPKPVWRHRTEEPARLEPVR